MTRIQRWIDALFLFVERLKGEKTVKERLISSEYLTQLTGYSVSGYEIRLYCQKKIYTRAYWKWFVPNETFATFRVFSVASHDAPASLKSACELEIDIPAMVPSFVSTDIQKETAIQAYLDILIEKIQMEKALQPV